jgi:superfamily II DNA or RNA helicase
MSKILSNEGYLIKKNESCNDVLIDKIKKELTVTPFLPFRINKDIQPESFTVYQENDEYISIPKYYGLQKCGPPDINNELNGEKINIQFNSELRDVQMNIVNSILPKIEKDDGGLLCLQCGGGKCHAKDTLILMYDGSISKVQDIKVGDKIMGDDSTSRTIISLARGRETMYKIHEIKGSSYIVNESHILSLRYKKGKIIDISVKDYLNLPKPYRIYGYRVPIIFSEKELEIDPYLVGMWIGDSLTNNLRVVQSNLIIKNGLLNIPNHYKCNSRKNQLALLAGIIDSVGECIYFYNVILGYKIIINKKFTERVHQLTNDIIYLTRSLGFKSYIDTNKNIIIQNYLSNGKKSNLNYKIKLEKLDVADYYGFEIDGNNRFVLGDFTVTHNTVISLYIACQLKLKTLVIVHKSFLLNQWVERANQFTNAKIGILQQKKIDIEGKDIVIGMLQSIAKDKYDSEIFKDFGLVIFDEAHHAPSKYFSKALPIIACKKTLSLSATWKRSDKLEKVLLWYFGPILYEQQSEKRDNVVVNVYNYTTDDPTFKEYKLYTGDINRAGTINKIVDIDVRNKFILREIKKILEEDGRKILILSDRISHLELLKNSLDYLKITTTGFYIGGLKQKVLDESAKQQVIFASYSMASEALDIPELNTLIMITPRKNITQSVGRILRKTDHIVTPLIIDIVDQLPCFINQGSGRMKFYHKNGYHVKRYDVKEYKIIKEYEIHQPQQIINNDCLFLDD